MARLVQIHQVRPYIAEMEMRKLTQRYRAIIAVASLNTNNEDFVVLVTSLAAEPATCSNLQCPKGLTSC
ncbi:hypothetical protein D5086_007119 [Populus alba]|uniref:Uncharacterized protein n=1 Tax=Populus alba TaxID=43335 RepID=A0ACC4CMW7_POPAL